MKSLYLLMIISLSVLLISCTTSCKPEYSKTSKNSHMAENNIPPAATAEKNPMTVAVYASGEKPSNSYKILGTEVISKFNYGGNKRQTASIHDAMRNLAAKMGGDAVINVATHDKEVTATVITYQHSPDKNVA